LKDLSAPATHADRVVLDLKERIFSGQLAPGHRLDEQDLATYYAVSRTPVREALRQLAAAGLAQARGRQGAVVAGLTVKRLIEIWQVLADLEGLSARLAARRATPALIEGLRQAHERLAAIVVNRDFATFPAANATFHGLIYEASQNRFLIESVQDLRQRTAIYAGHITQQPGRFNDTVAEHQAVLDAIIAHDGDAADSAMRKHLGMLGDSFADFLAGLPAVMLQEPVIA
jgi:DNA-binding GntR family transcriptional regulator